MFVVMTVVVVVLMSVLLAGQLFVVVSVWEKHDGNLCCGCGGFVAYSCDYGTLSLSLTRTSSKTWFVLT